MLSFSKCVENMGKWLTINDYFPKQKTMLLRRRIHCKPFFLLLLQIIYTQKLLQEVHF